MLRREQELASHIPHITTNQGQRSEGSMYVADMLLYVKKKQMSCVSVTIFKHVCTWHFCDPVRRHCFKGFCKCVMPASVEFLQFLSPPHLICHIVSICLLFTKKMYKTLNLTFTEFWTPCINFILLLFLSPLFFLSPPNFVADDIFHFYVLSGSCDVSHKTVLVQWI